MTQVFPNDKQRKQYGIWNLESLCARSENKSEKKQQNQSQACNYSAS